MIKRTLFFSNPAYLSLRLGQIVVKKPDSEEIRTVPIEGLQLELF